MADEDYGMPEAPSFQGYDPMDPNSVPQNYSFEGMDAPSIPRPMLPPGVSIEDLLNGILPLNRERPPPRMEDTQIPSERQQFAPNESYRMPEVRADDRTGDVNALDPTMFAGRRMNLMDVDPAEIMALKTIHGPKFR